MKSRYVQFRLTAVVLLSAIFVSFAVTVAASAQAQPGGESSIRFLTGKDDALSYRYDISVPLRVAIANFSTETVTITAELVNMGFRKDQGAIEQTGFLSETEVFTPLNTTEVGPGRAAILEFWPKPDVQLKSGTYTGFLSVRNEKNNELIYKPLQVTVPAGNVPEVEIEILNAGPLSYDYKDLVSGLDHIAIAVHNKGKDTAVLKWNVLTDLVDKDGKPVDLSFAPTQTITIKSGDVRILDLTLDKGSKESDQLRPGQYSGFVVLTDQNGDIKYAAFILSVPSASLAPNGEVSFDIVGIDASTPLKVDYQPLLEDKKIIAVAVENKGRETITLTGEIVLENLTDTSGITRTLNFTLENKLVAVESGKVVFLNFKLITPTMEAKTSPKIGMYKGYVLITAQEGGPSKHAPLILAVPSEDVAATGTYGPAFVEWLQGLSRSLTGLKIDLPVLVLLILFLGWVFRRLYLLLARGRPGPVTINEMVNAIGDDKFPTKGLDALLRDRLEDVGLRPGQAKPFDAVATAVGPLLATATVPVAPGLSFEKILNALVGLIFPPTGHKVVTTLRKGSEPNPHEIVFEIKDARTDETTMIDVAKGNTPENAVEEAASMIYHHVMMEHPHVYRRIPPWERFSTSKSVLLYQQGKRLEESARKPQTLDQALLKEALEKYKQAALEEPNNVNIRLGIIATQEGRNYLETLAAYLRVVEQWPELLEVRHRLAANLTFVDNLVAEWAKTTDEKKKDFKVLLERAIEDSDRKMFGYSIMDKDKRNLQDKIVTGSDDDLKQVFLQLAKYLRNDLKDQLAGSFRFWEWFWTWFPFSVPTRPGERRYLGLWLLWPWPWGKRVKFSKVVRLAEYCTCLRLLKYPSETVDGNWRQKLKKIVRQLKEKIVRPLDPLESLQQKVEKTIKPISTLGMNWRLGMNWQIHYTAACFYALAIPAPFEPPLPKDYPLPNDIEGWKKHYQVWKTIYEEWKNAGPPPPNDITDSEQLEAYKAWKAKYEEWKKEAPSLPSDITDRTKWTNHRTWRATYEEWKKDTRWKKDAPPPSDSKSMREWVKKYEEWQQKPAPWLEDLTDTEELKADYKAWKQKYETWKKDHEKWEQAGSTGPAPAGPILSYRITESVEFMKEHYEYEQWEEWEKGARLNAKEAVKHLNEAVRDPNFAEPEWLFDDKDGDPDLKYLRMHPEYIHWKSIVRPGEPKVSDEVSQTELDALCYAWKVLAVSAAIEAKTRKEHIKEVSGWESVYRQEVIKWCQRQQDLWYALLAWAQKPGKENLYTVFIKMTDANAKPPEKPTPSCKKEDFKTHTAHWKVVTERAEELSKRWDQRKTMKKPDGTTSITKDDVTNWAREAANVWVALETLANNPTDSWAKEEFEKTSK